VWGNTNSREGEGSIDYSVVRASDDLLLTLRYHLGDDQVVRLPIRILSTTPYFGGRRWWFVCPLTVYDVPCRRRFTKLHLHRGYFGCRNCHNLTYRSCQQAHQYERLDASVKKWYSALRQS
jgi:hypothetical protein